MNTERHAKAHNLLALAGASLINSCPGPIAASGSRLEFWNVPQRGLVILQLWDSGSVTLLADWPLGHTWNEFAAAILPPAPPKGGPLLVWTHDEHQFKGHLRGMPGTTLAVIEPVNGYGDVFLLSAVTPDAEEKARRVLDLEAAKALAEEQLITWFRQAQPILAGAP